MSNTPHELHEDFPAEADRIHALKITNAHFARLAEEYHSINRDVHRAESGVEPVSEQTETEMRRRRAHLKDEIARMLGSA
jgi:uncharacterized protein YdcH (DUF465 family)